MTVGELIRALSHFDPNLDVYFRPDAPMLGTVADIFDAREDEYSFFGVPIQCVILTNDKPEGD